MPAVDFDEHMGSGSYSEGVDGPPQHEECSTTECCGGCDEKQVDLADATIEQTTEAAIDLMVNILHLQQEIGRHIEVLNMVSQQMDELGVSEDAIAAMTLESLRRFGVPEENIEAVFAEMDAAWGESLQSVADTALLN